MSKIYLITYIEDNTIEGYVEKQEDFITWLKTHNKKRIEDGSEPEKDFEFKVEEINNLINKEL